MNKTLSVSAIKNGTVIDHVPAGQALRIVHMLGLIQKKRRITIGLKLSSQRLKLKDLIKIENHFLTHEEANKTTVFAPLVTINIIKNFDVEEKIITQLPESVTDVFLCPNPVCITHVEPIESFFMIEGQGAEVQLKCKFCEKAFDRNRVKVKI
jgi:aspartate carbamoyltransferase regulatory subunit